jgi:hypothetical protein
VQLLLHYDSWNVAEFVIKSDKWDAATAAGFLNAFKFRLNKSFFKLMTITLKHFEEKIVLSVREVTPYSDIPIFHLLFKTQSKKQFQNPLTAPKFFLPDGLARVAHRTWTASYWLSMVYTAFHRTMKTKLIHLRHLWTCGVFLRPLKILKNQV